MTTTSDGIGAPTQNQAKSSPPEWINGELVGFVQRKPRCNRGLGERTRKRHNRKEREALARAGEGPQAETAITTKPVTPQVERPIPFWVIRLGFEGYVTACRQFAVSGEWPNGIEPTHPSFGRLPIWQVKWIKCQKDPEKLAEWKSKQRKRKKEAKSLIREIDSLDVNTPLPVMLSPLAERLLARMKARAAA